MIQCNNNPKLCCILNTIYRYQEQLQNLIKNNTVVINCMHLHGIFREQQLFLSSVTKYNFLGGSYEIVGGATIQKHTCRYSTKRDMHLQQLVNKRFQNNLIKNLGHKKTRFCLSFYWTVLFSFSFLGIFALLEMGMV